MHANVAVGGCRMCKYARILVSQTFRQLRCLLLMWRVWFMQVWHGLSHKPLTLAFGADSCWLNQANNWSTSLHHHMWPPHMHCCELRYLNANKASGTSPHLFMSFLFSWLRWGKAHEGLHHPTHPLLRTTKASTPILSLCVCILTALPALLHYWTFSLTYFLITSVWQHWRDCN